MEMFKELERIKVQIRVRKMRHLALEDADSNASTASLLAPTNKYYDNEGNLLKNKVTLHTNQTTFQALKLYRNNRKTLTTVFIKIMPAGTVTKLVVDAKDSVFNLYNMFCSHSMYGSAKTPMILLPTLAGMFELHPDLVAESDLLLADVRGRDLLEDYGFTQHRGVVVLLFFANYKPLYVGSLLQFYFDKNIDFKINTLPTRVDLAKLPPTILEDRVQQLLRNIIEDEYRIQQEQLVLSFKKRGEEFRRSREAEIEKALRLEKAEREMREKNLIASTLRLEGQLKGFKSPEERLAAFKALKRREMKKRHGRLFRDGDSLSETSEMLRSLLSASDLESSSDQSSRVSLSDVNLDSRSTSSSSSRGSDSDSSSVGGSSSSDEEDEDEEESPRLTARSLKRKLSHSDDQLNVEQGRTSAFPARDADRTWTGS
jgi:glutamate synthase domain-containing protein 3